jgi:3-dehydroquinate dehydratase
MNYQLRKVTKNRSAFSTDDAIFKILYLAIRNASEKWTMPMIFCHLHKISDRLEYINQSGSNGFLFSAVVYALLDIPHLRLYYRE